MQQYVEPVRQMELEIMDSLPAGYENFAEYSLYNETNDSWNSLFGTEMNDGPISYEPNLPRPIFGLDRFVKSNEDPYKPGTNFDGPRCGHDYKIASPHATRYPVDPQLGDCGTPDGTFTSLTSGSAEPCSQYLDEGAATAYVQYAPQNYAVPYNCGLGVALNEIQPAFEKDEDFLQDMEDLAHSIDDSVIRVAKTNEIPQPYIKREEMNSDLEQSDYSSPASTPESYPSKTEEEDPDYNPRNSGGRCTKGHSRTSSSQYRIHKRARSPRSPRSPTSNKSKPRKQAHPRIVSSVLSPLSPNDTTTHPFTCPCRPYGCKSNFPNKNEWKRHFTSHHLSLGDFRCDLCPHPELNPNDFNRKDLFTQHLRRMHADNYPPRNTSTKKPGTATSTSTSPSTSSRRRRYPNSPTSAPTTPASRKPTKPINPFLEADLPAIHTRCWTQRHAPPRHAQCILCKQHFHGVNSAADWLEHLGVHLAKRAKNVEGWGDAEVAWEADGVLAGWMEREGLLKGGRLVQLGGGGAAVADADAEGETDE